MYQLPDLPYAYDALEPFIDSMTMQIHHDKHHATYVKNLNDALGSLPQHAEKDLTDLLVHLADLPESIRTKVRNNGGGHFNHSFFWTSMTPNPNSESRGPTGVFAQEVVKTFGNMESLKEKFVSSGLSRFGSGWVWLTVDKNHLVILDTPNQDSPIMEGRVPLLGLDVWEHAYYLKYQNKRADYIQAWWNLINWTQVQNRFVSAWGK